MTFVQPRQLLWLCILYVAAVAALDGKTAAICWHMWYLAISDILSAALHAARHGLYMYYCFLAYAMATHD